MNYSLFIICLTLVLCISIKQTSTVPMPPEQADVELVLDGLRAKEQDFQHLSDLLSEFVQSDRSPTIRGDMGANILEDQITQDIFNKQDSLPAEEIIGKKPPETYIPGATQERSCGIPHIINNRVFLQELVERIVELIFAKPAPNEVIMESREEWIQNLVNDLIANAGESEKEVEKNTAKSTISTTAAPTQLAEDTPNKTVKELADEIFKKPKPSNDGTTPAKELLDEIFKKPKPSNEGTTPATVDDTHNKTVDELLDEIFKKPKPLNEGTTSTPARAHWIIQTEEEEEACETLNAYEHELLQLALSHARFEKRLLLTNGRMPSVDEISAVDVVRAFIDDRLQAPQLTPLLVQAKRVDRDSILFEMAKAEASLEVMARARAYLKPTQSNQPTLRVEATDFDFMDIAMYARLGQ